MKKIKESGFTLIELLGTIVIIGILGTIAVTSVVNIKKSSNIRFDNSQVELMKQAGQTYFTDNKRLLPIVEGQINYVTLDKLIEKGYINKLYNSKKEEFDPTTSYAWVQKQNDGSYKYDCYCEIKGKKLAGTTAIPESKANNSIVTFEYENFYNNKSENKYYTNGKNNSIVKVHLNRNEVSEYRYEIYKKDTNNEDSQYKISQREKPTSNLVNIKLNAKDYSDGEYFIKVTTYNSTGNSNQSSSSAKIYVDKTPPTCNITTTYQKDSNSVQNLWYSSKSKNSNNQELGASSKLPISVDGSDKGSGIKSGSKHIFSDSEYTNQIDNETGTYEAENTGKNGKEYYATVEDNVGNKAKCSQLYYIDTTPPTCSEKGIEKGKKGNKVQDKQWYLGDVTTYGYFTDENSGVTNEKQLSKKLTETNKNAQTSTITQKDNAGNEGRCVINNIYIDKEDPTCTSSGGSSTWINANSANKSTILKGTCSDVGSGCVAGSESDRRYDDDGNVYWDITWEGNWNNLSPGTVYDESGRSKTCPGNQTVKHDWTAPTCSISLSDKDKGNNVEGIQWYRGNVTASLSITDEGPPGRSAVTPTIDGKTSQTTITKTDSGKYTVNGKVIDEAGNSNTCQSAAFGIDKTNPTCPTRTISPLYGNSLNPQTWTNVPIKVNITNTNSDTYSGVDYWNWSVKDSASNKIENAFYFQEQNKGDKEYSFGLEANYEGKIAGRVDIYDNAGNHSQCDTNGYWIDRKPPTCPKSSITESFAYPTSDTPETDVWTNIPINVNIPVLNLDSGKGSNVYWNWTIKDKDNKKLSDLSQSMQTSADKMIKMIGNSPKEYEGKMTGIFEIKDEAGNSSICYKKTFFIDTKPPNCQTTGNSDNWVNTDVTLKGTCSDSGSDCSDDTKTVTKTISNDTNDVYSPGIVTDKAGNSSNCDKVRVKIDKTPPNCNPGGNVAGWTNQNLTLTGTCFDSMSGCNPLKTNVTSYVTTEISNDNYSYGEVEDNAGNIGYCSVAVHTDQSKPKCNNKKLIRGNGDAIAENTWLSIKKAKYIADCVDTGGSGCIQTSYSTETTNEGTTILKIAISDNAGNVHDCESKTVKIDRTAPKLSATALNLETSFSQSGCGTSDNCQLFYGNIEKKNRGVKLTANNNTGASDHSPIADWGAQAKYETGGTGCALVDGIDWKWSGQAVCDSQGSGKVKRCYKVKDAAGNQSDRVCTCQGPKGGISIKKPSDCF